MTTLNDAHIQILKTAAKKELRKQAKCANAHKNFLLAVVRIQFPSLLKAGITLEDFIDQQIAKRNRR